MNKKSIVMSEKIDTAYNKQPMDEDQFDVCYSIVLEDLSRSINKHLGLYFNDHALYRLCKDLEQGLKEGENYYE